MLTGSSGDAAFQISASATDLFLVSLHHTLLGGLKIHVATIDPATGQRSSQYVVSSEGDIGNSSDVLHVGANSAFPLIAWTDKSRKTLKVNILGNKNVISLTLDNGTGEEPEAVALHAPYRSNALAHFLVHLQTATQHWAEVFHVDLRKATISKAYSLPKVSGKGAFSCSTVDANIFFTRVTDSETILISSSSHGILERHPLAQASQHKQPLHVVSEVAVASASSYPTRAAVLTDAGEWILLRNGDTLWSRPEFLAHAAAATFAETSMEPSLVQELEAESQQNIVAAFFHRCLRHLQFLQNLPAFVNHPGSGSSLGSSSAHVDKFGLFKTIVFALPPRTIAAFDTARPAEVLWRTDLPPANGRNAWTDVRILPAEPGTVQVSEHGEKAHYLVDTLTGKVIAEPDLAVDLERIPTSDNLQQIEVNNAGLRGYPLKDPNASTWHLKVQSPDRIVCVTSRPVTEPVASIGRALGDRRVLYKYLNPNLALIMTANDEAATLTTILLDGASGRVLNTASYSGVDASKPVTAVLSSTLR